MIVLDLCLDYLILYKTSLYSKTYMFLLELKYQYLHVHLDRFQRRKTINIYLKKYNFLFLFVQIDFNDEINRKYCFK